MNFRTEICIDADGIKMRHDEPMMMLGSCFSDSIGARLADAMVNVLVNPLGTVYNPLSLASAVQRIVECRTVSRDELFEAGGVWNCFDFHSRFSLADADATLQLMNDSITAAHHHLKRCRYLFVTPGTAITYSHDGCVVNNCHKLPSREFVRSMRSVSEIARVLDDMVAMLAKFNPALKVIFTVSPIRHIADGLTTNSLSKSTLRVAINEVMQQHPEVCRYFPSYEILIDDLRDYRFYAADMVHPSDTAVEYIWQMLKSTYFDTAQCQRIERCERMTKRLRHRPMSQNPDVVAKFRADTEAALAALRKELPYLNE